MRTLITLGWILAIIGSLHGQVRSTLSLMPGTGTEPPTARLVVVIEPGWHISSLTQEDGGPVRSTIEIAKNQAYRLAGPIKSPAPHKAHSTAFDIEVQTHEGTVEFVLPLEKNPEAGNFDPSKLTVEFTYQACTEETCLLPKTDTVTAVAPPTQANPAARSGSVSHFESVQAFVVRKGIMFRLDFLGADAGDPALGRTAGNSWLNSCG